MTSKRRNFILSLRLSIKVDSKIQSSTDKCIFRYRQLNVRALFPSLNCARRFVYSAVGSSWKLEGAVEHLIDGTCSEKRICRLSFEF